MTDAIFSGSPATSETIMAVHQLLLRGMLVGIVAGLLAFAFARTFGEPSVDRAIAFEAAEAKAKGETPDPEIFSREVQASIGLATGVTVYGAALGGIFSLVFALCYGRIGRMSPRACAAVIAGLGFVAIYVVPYLKYPANPPSIGEPATIGMRTGLYFSMIALSVIAMMVAVSLARLSEARFGRWNSILLGGLAFIVMVAVAQFALPGINEVPTEFPATTLWQFRVAAIGIQAVIWTVIGLLFGALTERSLRA
jgi:predicted cobalt transporter CbtA